MLCKEICSLWPDHHFYRTYLERDPMSYYFTVPGYWSSRVWVTVLRRSGSRGWNPSVKPRTQHAVQGPQSRTQLVLRIRQAAPRSVRSIRIKALVPRRGTSSVISWQSFIWDQSCLERNSNEFTNFTILNSKKFRLGTFVNFYMIQYFIHLKFLWVWAVTSFFKRIWL